MNPSQAAFSLGVSLDEYLRWESGEEEGPLVDVALEPQDHYVVLRFRQGWTMKELAKKIGCSSHTVASAERGLRSLKILIDFWGH